MKLYKEHASVIYATQNKDPFFAYLTNKIFEEIDWQKKGKLLDLGCGSGRIVFEAAKRGFEAVGIDSVGKAITIANSKAKQEVLSKKVKFIKADLTKLRPCQFGLFDYIVLMEVIEHIEEYQKVLDFAFTSLKKGGKLLLTTPNDPSQWTILDDYAQHVRRFTLMQVRKALQRFGSVHLYTVGFPLHRLSLYIYNILLRFVARSHEPKNFRRSPLVSMFYYRVGTAVMTFDDLFTFVPWGDTIIVVAKK